MQGHRRTEQGLAQKLSEHQPDEVVHLVGVRISSHTKSTSAKLLISFSFKNPEHQWMQRSEGVQLHVLYVLSTQTSPLLLLSSAPATLQE